MEKIRLMKSNATYPKKNFGTNENEENKFRQYKKVRDHCHYRGKFRWAAYSICNLRYKLPKKKFQYYFITVQYNIDIS